MIDGIEQFYQRIARSIEEAIAEEWATARIDAIYYADGATFVGEYTRQADGKLRSFGISMACIRGFKELRKKFREAGKPVWGQATFDLDANGKFKVNWGYENCNANGDTLFDEQEDMKRTKARQQRLRDNA